MTKQAMPELLDLAEAVASGELRSADAERQLRAALEADDRASEKAVRELRALVLATTAVRSHARATHEAAVAESLDVAEGSGSIATVVPNSVRGVRRLSSRNGDGRGPRPRRTWLLVAATIAVGTGVMGASLLGGQAPTPGPAISNAIASATLEPSQVPSTDLAPGPGALIAYTRGTDKPNRIPGDPNRTLCNEPEPIAPTCSVPRLWVVGSDGSNAHELLPDGVSNQSALAWSPDGTRLLYSDDGTLYMTDASGTEPQRVDTGCVDPCRYDGGAAFSSDGAHLVILRTSSDADGYDRRAVVTTLDLASGRVAELSSTAQAGAVAPAGWSPDASQIVFSTFGDKDSGISGPIAPIKAAVFVVDADGQNLRQISPTTINAGFGGWSPDGARIVFASSEASGQDVYTVRPDGTDLRRLTSDGISSGATWMPDGRILFVRGSGGDGPRLWTMDADGTNAAELLSAAVTGAAPGDFGSSLPVWQPSSGVAILPPPWNPSTGIPIGPPVATPAATPMPELAAGFSWTGSMHGAEDGASTATATLLADGRVLVTFNCGAAAELYDPVTGTFSPTGSLAVTRSGQTATRLLDGRVLLTGGDACGTPEQGGVLASAEIYSPLTGTFSPTGSMGTPRRRHTATLLNDGRVLITGGMTGAAPAIAFEVVLASYRGGSAHQGAPLAATTDDELATAELYDPATGKFSPTGSMTDYRSWFSATLLQDGRVLVVGGGGEYDSLTSAELYDPATGAFGPTGSMAQGRCLHTATLLQDGRVLITGGRASDGTTYTSAELYDPSSAKFSSAGSMEARRKGHTATLLRDGRVLIAGGYAQDEQTWRVLSSTEIYVPGSGFTLIGSMGEMRDGHTATLLNDGRVLIAGGEDIGHAGISALTSAVLYQP